MEPCRTCINCISQYGIFVCKVNKAEIENIEESLPCSCYMNAEKPEWKIWLDDIRTPPNNDWIWEKSVAEVMVRLEIANLLGYDIAILSLDNDLGDGEQEGYVVLDKLEERTFRHDNFKTPKKIQIHSANPVARRRMEQIIEKNGWK